jgi:hypothetical protein
MARLVRVWQGEQAKVAKARFQGFKVSEVSKRELETLDLETFKL